MKDYNQEYFYMKSTGNKYPMLDFTGSQSIGNSELFYYKEAIITKEAIPLIYAPPIPRKPELADVLHIDGNLAISKQLKTHIEELNLKNVQFIPATIQDLNDEVHEGFYIIHVYNLITCSDLENSKWRTSRRNPNRVMSFDKLVLDNKALNITPLEDRLVIAVAEKHTYHIYHYSVVSHILKLHPTGVTFYRLSKFTGKEPFEDEFLEYIKE